MRDDFDTANGIYSDAHFHKQVDGLDKAWGDNPNHVKVFENKKRGGLGKTVPQSDKPLDLSKGFSDGSTFVPDEERTQALSEFGVKPSKPSKAYSIQFSENDEPIIIRANGYDDLLDKLVKSRLSDRMTESSSIQEATDEEIKGYGEF